MSTAKIPGVPGGRGLLCSARSDAGWLKPWDSSRLTGRKVCAVSLKWLDEGRQAGAEVLAGLERERALVMLGR